MRSQIDAITRYVEMGYKAFTGQIPACVYEKLNCPEPIFAKWLYRQAHGEKTAICVGCDNECKLNANEDFMLEPQEAIIDYKRPYAITPTEMIKRHVLLTAKQAAYCLCVSERTIYNMIEDGRLAKLRVNPVRVRAADIERFMNDFDE